MAIQHLSPALCAPASSPAYPMANPGYGKRSVPDRCSPRADDFALLPERERYVAGFVDHLPDGAAINVKTLAKQLPLYGQQAVGSALTALSVAGHLRRVRRAVGEGEQVRWVFRTFWSRTARDNAWWADYLDAEDRRGRALAEPGEHAAAGDCPGAGEGAEPIGSLVPAPVVPAPRGAVPLIPAPRVPMPRVPEPSAAVDESAVDESAVDEHAVDEPAVDASAVDVPSVAAQLAPGCPSPAYLALARLGRVEHRLALSAADCEALEAGAAEWFARGVSADYLIQALSAGLPARVESPVGFLRHRLRDKIPPALPAMPDSSTAPPRRVLVECTRCGTPGRPEALPDGLCRPCRQDTHGETDATQADAIQADATQAVATEPVIESAAGCGVRAYVGALRDLLTSP
ncbi:MULTISPECIES: MarR family transcriptional regulator [unclassified Streptomyces]|uniref:MarR family transcriptional regulator n=1 Tax=unclassified Streptomyces TaxID=2593676 RepID=UPI0036E6AA17